MVRDDAKPEKRSVLEITHYALACTGFFTAVSAVVVSSAGWAVCGLLMMLWSMAYFFMEED